MASGLGLYYARVKGLACETTYTMAVIIVIFTVFNLFMVHCEEVVKIKIVDSPALSRYNSPSSSQQKLTLRTQPLNVTGPPHLRQFNGSCFEGTERGYKYRVCPFQNVTQKEERQSWMSYHGVLGVWRDWIVENDTFVGMKFVMGEQCGAVDREAQVMLNCSTKTRVHNVTEPSTCSYTIWFDTPLACFKGAMQVYQVLTKKQLEDWDKADIEYYSNEITFQGLTKRRRSILVDAGLCSPRKARSETKPEEIVLTANEEHADDKSKELLQCQQENEALQKQLRELNLKLNNISQPHPNVTALHNSNRSVNVSPTAAHNVSVTTVKSNNNTEAHSKVHEALNSDIEERKLSMDSIADKNPLISMERSPRNDGELVIEEDIHLPDKH